MYVVQYKDENSRNRVAIYKERKIYPLTTERNLYQIAFSAINKKLKIAEALNSIPCETPLSPSQLFQSIQFLPPINHSDPSHIIVSGTGLTHINSAMLRKSMHSNEYLDPAQSIYMNGVNFGKSNETLAKAIPEWFFKGLGHNLKPTNTCLEIPSYSHGGGEEAEIVAIYLNDADGQPHRIGFALGNEFSDHKLENKNPYYLAQSKLRDFSIGPEIYLGEFPSEIRGNITVLRNNQSIWRSEFLTGSEHMSFDIAALEYHAFKHKLLRQPGDINMLFLGADKLSYNDDLEFMENDFIKIEANLFNLPLVNKVKNKEKEFSSVSYSG